MESTILSTVQSIVESQWTYFFATNPSFKDSSGNDLYVGPAQFMGYSGAALSVFISCIGAYQVSTQAIIEIEDGMDSFLQYFGKDSAKILKDLVKDESASNNMSEFLKTYTYDLIILIIAIFWHVFFLIAMGSLMSWTIFQNIKNLDTTANGGDIDINAGWKLLLFGTFFGTVNYLAANSLELS